MAIPIIGDLINGVKDIVSEVVVDKDKRAELDIRLAELEDRTNQRAHEQVMGQIATNTAEASNGSLFVAGWRPAVGWVSAAGFAYSVILQPFLNWASRVWGYVGDLPVLDDALLITTMAGMLGIGTMRTIEKVKGVSTNDYTDVPGRTAPATATANVTVEPNGEVSVQTKAPTVTPAVVAPTSGQVSVSPKKKKWKLF